MKKPLSILAVALISTTLATQAELREVLLADWPSFTLDVDGDGVADFAGSTSDTNNVTIISYTDGSISPHSVPGARAPQGGYGAAWQFADLSALEADAIYAGDLSLNTPLFGDLHLGEGNPVVFNLNATEPIWAGWRFGTAGTGNDPFSIIGAVCDATEFFSSGGTAPIKLYTHLYGTIGLGDPAISVSLATALGAGGGTAAIDGILPTTATFTSPKAGTITTPSVSGKTYRLWRTTAPGSPGTILDTKAGTGSPLVFTFDDSASGLPKAFYFLTES